MTQRFFYTTHTPYRYSSGPELHFWNDKFETITSIEEAEALARKHQHISGDDYCVETAYGAMIELPRR